MCSSDLDISYVRESAAAVAKHLKPGTMVVLESTTYPGTTEELIKPILEQGSGLTCGRVEKQLVDKRLSLRLEQKERSPLMLGKAWPQAGRAAGSCLVTFPSTHTKQRTGGNGLRPRPPSLPKASSSSKALPIKGYLTSPKGLRLR